MARRTLTRSGFGTNVTSPFAPRHFRAARLHPRRDDEGHGDGGAVDDGNEGDNEGDTPDGEQPEGKPNAKPEIDWKAESRKHEREAKANRSAAAELAKLKQSQMSEAEKIQAERDQAAKDAAEARAELAVERAARKHGITEDKDLDLLAGLPADKVDAFAKRLSEANKPAPAGRSGNPVGGAKQATPLEQQIADATAKRDFQRVIALKQQQHAK